MTEREQIEQAIAALEAQRSILGEAVVDTSIAAMREKLAALIAAEQTNAARDEQLLAHSAQRKQVTILFGDLFGFTHLAGTMDPEDVRDLVNALWNRLDAVIVAYGGTIDKHIGDAVMAIFGAPIAREDDPERAVRAALAMQSEVHAFVEEQNLEKLNTLANALRMRIGVHTGTVSLGSVGSTAEYTAIGDVVNLADRLQEAAPASGILISHDTYRHVRGVFEARLLDPIFVKGKTEPIQVYMILEEKPRAFRLATRGVEGIETRMIGRAAELQVLKDATLAIFDRHAAQIVTVVGDAGVGKSRLLYEFNNWAELLPDKVWLFRGRAQPQLSQLPYALIRDLFAFRFEIRDSDRASIARQKLEQGIIGFIGAEGIEKAHFIGHLIGFDFSTSPYLQGILHDARQIRDRAFHYLAQFFSATTQDRPVAVLLEDAHWADDGSLDLIEYLVNECQQLPLMIIALTRPTLFEQRAKWGHGWGNFKRIDLHPLAARDSQELIAEILRKVPDIPAALKDLIVDRSEGNPFYVEELIKVLIEDGVIIKGAERWSIKTDRLPDLRVPATLTGVLQARLDRLPSIEREILQRASVVGRVFWDEAVERLHIAGEGHTAQHAQNVRTALAALQAKEMIFERGTPAFAGTHEFIFKHAILRDVTYESVLLRLRRIYHAQAAEWLIERSGERIGEYAGLIGEHYDRAGDKNRAAEWYGRAGKQAKDTYALQAAVSYYRKALEFLPRDERADRIDPAKAALRLSWQDGLGEVLRWQAHYAEALEIYQAMQSEAEAANDQMMLARSWNRMSWVQDHQGNYRAVLDSAEHAEQIARAAGEAAQEELARSLFIHGWGCYRLGDAEAALAFGQKALAFSLELRDAGKQDVGFSQKLLGAVYQTLGRFEEANRSHKNALAVFGELGDRPGVAAELSNLGENARARGDHRAAAALFQDALSIAREVGLRSGEILYLSNLGGARVALGDYRTGVADLQQVLKMPEAVDWYGLPDTYRHLAVAYLGQNQIDQALAFAQKSLSLSMELGEQELVGLAWRVLGQIAAHGSQPTEVTDRSYDAAACFTESLRIFQKLNIHVEEARTLRAWAIVELDNGDAERGRQMWHEAYTLFEQYGLDKEIERMKNDPMAGG
jgi:class 3 adenylate cyclase/tetratricopeptide (TPR) repeat protein